MTSCRTLGRTRQRAGVALLCGSLVAAPLQAQQANPVAALSDLVYQSYDHTQSQLHARGYSYVHADQRGSKQWQYWWLQKDHLCARVAYVDRRATSIVEALATDCNRQPATEASKDRGMSTGAKVALGAAALLGVAALAHRSHERDQEKHKNEQQVAEYERGYRDGLYHQPYHDYNRSPSYVDGFHAGQQKRDAETSYRSPYGHHSGHAAFVNLNDLVGSRGSSADDALHRRGFVSMGGYKSGSRSFSTWWSASTRQCVQAVTADGRIQAIHLLYEGNCT
ncbi:hypothetical protein [uncultured Piscinibacter sp.]|uniref:hypothetical protein n=1 Tax=uncultured Piscinibacter sp. TaxID=1131835 RepID=UPI00262362CB|nr:hypothetical protein [uncultured Piscinibacter sp.]